ncbi:MAG: chemotaxis response regulator protein-glutamate methylesterase [Candidimonas sp.]|nr:MAG: chemotaxis response regulator protein-glutamate methylesterase [Candidimonas sp.]
MKDGKGPIRVLCVDDSALVRAVMSQILNAQTGIEVVGTAPDPLVAREMIKRLDPDVLTLDVEMPRMDGLEFLARLMRLRPMPVVMVSSLTERGSEVTLRALELGAVDFITKPQAGVRDGLLEYAEMIAAKIRAAASARPRSYPVPADGVVARLAGVLPSTEKLIFIGASTGGTEAIRRVLERLPAGSPAVLITQHMPAGFTRSFVKRLDGLCAVRVHEAADGDHVLPGHVYLAPGGVAHLCVARSGAHYVTRLDTGDPVNRHRPSVEVMFQSAARVAGANAVGAILTGMGKDGARGLLEMREAGARTFAEDEASCVVFGMPREALAIGAAEEAVALEKMAARLLDAAGALARTSHS